MRGHRVRRRGWATRRHRRRMRRGRGFTGCHGRRFMRRHCRAGMRRHRCPRRARRHRPHAAAKAWAANRASGWMRAHTHARVCLGPRMRGRAGEHRRPGSRKDRRVTVIGIEPQITILLRHLHVLHLHRRWPNMRLMREARFLRGRCTHHTAGAIETGARHVLVPHDLAVVYVGYVHIAKTVDRAVVGKHAAAPETTFVAYAAIAEAVIDAAVIPYMRTPVAGIEQILATNEAPVTWGPQQPDLGRFHPGARHPVIAELAIGPVTRGPDIPWRRQRRLVVNRQLGRRHGHGNVNAKLRRGRSRQCHCTDPDKGRDHQRAG
jgi:hypothetical protein